MILSMNPFITKKKVQSNFDELKKVNISCTQFIEHLRDTYTFTGEELENLNNMEKHFYNLNVIFQKMSSTINKQK
jgi:septation ring formation regulator EzrA